jgi:hypothetical protein
VNGSLQFASWMSQHKVDVVRSGQAEKKHFYNIRDHRMLKYVDPSSQAYDESVP